MRQILSMLEYTQVRCFTTIIVIDIGETHTGIDGIA